MILVDGILRNDGEGIGLYRTEFLYMELPKEMNPFLAVAEEVSKELDKEMQPIL